MSKTTAKAKPAAKSKTDTVVAMLRKGATRQAIVAATSWPSIDLKQLAARKSLKLRKAADGTIRATGGR